MSKNALQELSNQLKELSETRSKYMKENTDAWKYHFDKHNKKYEQMAIFKRAELDIINDMQKITQKVRNDE